MLEVSPPTDPRVFILEDDAVMGLYYEKVLRKAGFALKRFHEGDAFLNGLPSTGIACALLDIHLPGKMNGPDVFHEMARRHLRIPSIFVSAYATVPVAVDVVRAGALDVLEKKDIILDSGVLVHAIGQALEVAEDWARLAAEQKQDADRCGSLSPREHETLSWIITGMLNKQIAAELGITERTVKAHRTAIMKKLGVCSAVEMARIASNCGILPART